jgi:hypothetical protein
VLLRFPQRVAAIDSIKVSTGYGLHVDMGMLRFSHGIPKIAHSRVKVGRDVPTRGKFIKIERKPLPILSKEQERYVEAARDSDGECRPLILPEGFGQGRVVPDCYHPE